MSSVETFTDSINFEGKGIHAVIWSEKEELVHALLIILCKLRFQTTPFLLDSTTDSVHKLNLYLSSKPNDFKIDHNTDEITIKKPDSLLLLFLQQATGTTFGPVLNGWRALLADSPGTILFIRSADLIGFLRAAPDLASFIGPKLFDTTIMLNLWSKTVAETVSNKLPKPIWSILEALPGTLPSKEAIDEWLSVHPPL